MIAVTRYRVPVADQLLAEKDSWQQVEGFRLISVDGPWSGHPGVIICTFEDDHAPAEFEGQLVEPVFRQEWRDARYTVSIISRELIAA